MNYKYVQILKSAHTANTNNAQYIASNEQSCILDNIDATYEWLFNQN